MVRASTGTLSYLKAPTLCVSCHQNPHGETRDSIRKCERCHDARSWSEAQQQSFEPRLLADREHDLE